MTHYVCVEIVQVANGYVPCKTWAVVQSPLQDLAITGGQSLALSAIIASLFLLVKAYKIAMKSLNSI